VSVVLSDVGEVIAMYYHGASAWAKTHQIETVMPDGEPKSYFLKVRVLAMER
jgi:hypothetical protein